MRLGVFDSGIGGEAVAGALRTYFPEAIIITVNDHEHVPYGNLSAADIIRFTNTALQPLLRARCDVIVIACNTATAIAIEHLRRTYPKQKFIGIEPMIKTAAAVTKTGVVAVCATPATLSSSRYKQLVSRYAPHLHILEPDCQQWANMIEHGRAHELNVIELIDSLCTQGADVIVLGCTHYHWIKTIITDATRGRAQVLEPSDAIGRRITDLLTTA